MSIQSQFGIVGVVLFGLVVGVSVLQVVFSSGGPYGQSLGLLQGRCIYSSDVFATTLSIDPDTAEGVILDRDVAMSNRVQFEIIPPTGLTVGGSPVTGIVYTVQRPAGSALPARYHQAIVAIGPALGTGCDINAAPEMSVAATTSAGNAAMQPDAQLSSNPYVGILLALFLILPLGFMGFMGIKFFRDRG